MSSKKKWQKCQQLKLACPPQLKSINTRRDFLVYIPANRVTETIHFRCVKKEGKKEEEKPGC
jgi:hypothetical protein